MKKILKGMIKGLIKGAIYIWCKIFYGLKIVGLENIPKDEPLIFVGNHRTFLDPPLIVITAKREMRFLAKEDLFKNNFFSIICKLFDAIPVKRDEKEIYAIKESLKTLKNGMSIGLFPEGTRNGIEKGQKAKDGVAFFTVRSGAKILPCGIKGGIKGNRKITITYGKPLDFSQYKGSKDKEVLDKITEEIMENIIELTK